MRKIKQYIIPIYIAICLLISMFIYLTIKLDNPDRGKAKIGVTYMTMNNTFYQAITNEIQKVVNENNDIVYIRDPALNEKNKSSKLMILFN